MLMVHATSAKLVSSIQWNRSVFASGGCSIGNIGPFLESLRRTESRIFGKVRGMWSGA